MAELPRAVELEGKRGGGALEKKRKKGEKGREEGEG